MKTVIDYTLLAVVGYFVAVGLVAFGRVLSRSVQAEGGTRRGIVDTALVGYWASQLPSDGWLAAKTALRETLRTIIPYQPPRGGARRKPAGWMASGIVIWTLRILTAPFVLAALVVVVPLVALVSAVLWTFGLGSRLFARLLRRHLPRHDFHCPTCKTRSRHPWFVCTCGNVHERLEPGVLGARARRCGCDEALLPTTDGGGRRQLTMICSSGHVIAPFAGQCPEVVVEIAGPARSGRTVLVGAVLRRLAALTTFGSLAAGIGDDRSLAAASELVVGVDPAGDDHVSVHLETADGRVNVLICDADGETWHDIDGIRRRNLLQLAPAIVLLVDPIAITTVYDRVAGRVVDPRRFADESSTAVLERVLAGVGAAYGHGREVPLAVVVTKTDLFGIGAEIDAAGPVPAEGRPTSDSDRVRAWLLVQGEGNFVLAAEQRFPQIRFFRTAVSPSGTAGVLAPIAWVTKVRAGVDFDDPGDAAAPVPRRPMGVLTLATPRTEQPRRVPRRRRTVLEEDAVPPNPLARLSLVPLGAVLLLALAPVAGLPGPLDEISSGTAQISAALNLTAAQRPGLVVKRPSAVSRRSWVRLWRPEAGWYLRHLRRDPRARLGPGVRLAGGRVYVRGEARWGQALYRDAAGARVVLLLNYRSGRWTAHDVWSRRAPGLDCGRVPGWVARVLTEGRRSVVKWRCLPR